MRKQSHIDRPTDRAFAVSYSAWHSVKSLISCFWPHQQQQWQQQLQQHPWFSTTMNTPMGKRNPAEAGAAIESAENFALIEESRLEKIVMYVSISLSLEIGTVPQTCDLEVTQRRRIPAGRLISVKQTYRKFHRKPPLYLQCRSSAHPRSCHLEEGISPTGVH